MSRKGDALARLKAVRERNELARELMDAQADRFNGIRHRKENGTGPVAVTGFNLFPTPPELARRMVELAEIQDGARVLEPSAGTGRILDALPDRCHVVAVEIERGIQAELYRRYPRVSLKCGDFLARSAADLGGEFDRVVMNPPFKNGADVKHIAHALWNMLKTGGVLVALCYDGARQNRDLKPLADHWEVLPAGSFRSEGTSAGVALLVIRKA